MPRLVLPDAEAGVLHAVHDAVARAGKPDAILPGDGGQENVVIRGVGVDIEQVVVQIAHRHVRADTFDAHAFQCQIAHDGVDIVGEGLVKLDVYLVPRVMSEGLVRCAEMIFRVRFIGIAVAPFFFYRL